MSALAAVVECEYPRDSRGYFQLNRMKGLYQFMRILRLENGAIWGVMGRNGARWGCTGGRRVRYERFFRNIDGIGDGSVYRVC